MKVKVTKNRGLKGVCVGDVLTSVNGYLYLGDKSACVFPYKENALGVEEWNCQQWDRTPFMMAKFELVEEENMFTKDDLKVGYVIKQRCGELAIIAMIDPQGKSYVRKCGGWLEIEKYDECLTFKSDSDLDIMKVYGYAYMPKRAIEISTDNRKLLWERKESPIEITIEEIAKKFGVDSDRIRIKE